MKHGLCPFFLCALLLLGFVSSAAAQEWTRFRGPDGCGISEAATIPVTWTSENYNWRVSLPGIGHSSPVIWGERIFVTSAIEKDATLILQCLNTADGSPIWRRGFQSTPHAKNDFNSYAAASPALDESRVYITWATPEKYTVLALEQSDGREVWRRDLGPFIAQHGYGASPIVFEDLLIVTNDQDETSFATALDCATGQTRWKVDRRIVKAAYSTPMIFRPEGRPPELILTGWAHGVASLDPRTGKTNWELDVLNHRVVCSPMTAAGLIFTSCGSGGGGKQMVAVRPADPTQGVEAGVAYEITNSLPYVPTSVARGNLLFLWSDSGVVACLDAPTGEVHWRERVGGNYFGSPVRVGDRIYCMSRHGKMVVVAADDEFKLLGRIDLQEPTQATAAISGGVMYLRTRSHLMAIGGQ